MKQLRQVLHCYNVAAEGYAKELLNELDEKPLDKLLLQQFAKAHKDKGLMGDLGCGPGQTTHFLHQQGVHNLLGIDLSPKMIEQAKKYFNIPFEVGNILELNYPSNHFGSLIAFYAIVHFDYEEVRIALQEIFRVLQPTGTFLFTFHIGDEILNKTDFFAQKVNVNFHFLNPDKILEIAQKVGFTQKEVIIRYPYEGKEYQSRRAYITLVKT